MDIIMVEVNQFSKLAKMGLIKATTTTFDMAKIFFNMWAKHHKMLHFIMK